MQKSFRAILLTLIVGILAFSSFIVVLAQGTVLADTGFRPQTHGFSFANYGNETKPVNLTPAAMQKIFGDSVCKSTTNGCVLSATSQVWMDKINADMNGGHCEGMAALSSLIASGKVNLKDLDPNANSVQDLKADNPKVQEEIARWFATQYVAPTATAEIKDQTPTQLVDTMIDQLKAGTGPFTMGIYQADGQGGHAITPYSVVDMGNGIVRVMVYDNNYPGEERFIEVDRNANSWKYTGTTNPNEPVSEYHGDANSFSLTLTPVGARVTQPQECSFCKQDGSTTTPDATTVPDTSTNPDITATPGTTTDTVAAGGCTTSVTTGADTDVVVTDSEGNKAGVIKGHAFSNIKGAVVLRPRSQGGLADDTPGAVVIVPAGSKMSAVVNGKGSNDVLVTGCGGYQRVQGMSQEDGKPDTIAFPADASKITVETDPNNPIEISGGYDNPNGNDYTYDLTNVTSENGGPIEVGADSETGEFKVASSGGATFDANFTSLDENGDTVEKNLPQFSVDENAGVSGSFDDAISNESPTFNAAEAPNWDDFTSLNDISETILSDTETEIGGSESTTGDDQSDANATEVSGSDGSTDTDNADASPTESADGSDDSGSSDGSGG